MIRALLLAALAATPACAQHLPGFAGTWQGEGTLTREAEPAQRFRCRLSFEPLPRGEMYLVGRCATAQAQQSFRYTLSEDGQGGLSALDRLEGGEAPPARLAGTIAPGLLRLEAEDGVLALARGAQALHLTLEGRENGRALRGEASLTPRD